MRNKAIEGQMTLDNYDFEKELEKATSQITGIDFDNQDDEYVENEGEEKPFDADKIRIDQQMLSVKYICELMESDMIDTNPNFQRKGVWKDPKKKSLLIESLMLRIPIPAFYFFEDEDSTYQVIDGQQRIRTINDFIGGKFKLTGLEYLKDTCGGKYFEGLDKKYQQRIYRTQLAVNILDVRSPKNVIYDIFRRVNTGGMPLTLQEMRNAICKPKVREFLCKMATNEAYLIATRKKIKDERMDSQEMVLRFYAFWSIYKDNKLEYTYKNVASMLDDAIEKLNKYSQNELDQIYNVFNRSMIKCEELFGRYAFSKLQFDEATKKVKRPMDLINKSLFSSFSVLLSDDKYANIDLRPYQERAIEILGKKLVNPDYFNSITMGTGDKKRIDTNFRFSMEVLEECQIGK